MPFTGYQDLDPAFAAALQAYINANPGVSAFSGYRSPERQRELFNASDQSGHSVARPGHSLHEAKQAADLAYNGVRFDRLPREQQQALHQSAGGFGLKFPMSWEAWHVEPYATRGGRMAGGGDLPGFVRADGSYASSAGGGPPLAPAESGTLGTIFAEAVPETPAIGGSVLPEATGLRDLSGGQSAPVNLEYQQAGLTPEELLEPRRRKKSALADIFSV